MDSPERRFLTESMRIGEPIDESVAVVVPTSGTTGTPKGAMLSAAALRASIDATHQYLGGPGCWLLALPAHHIAGLQVLLRSIVADTEPSVIDVSGGFHPEDFATATSRMPGPRRYTALVPGQLRKSLENRIATDALASLDAVLVGGAALLAQVADRAADNGINIIRTYGMSETCGGCVYNGTPLPGVSVEIHAPPGQVGQISISGPMVALGYRNTQGSNTFDRPRWYRTDDVGTIRGGVLDVIGRADDAISSGGLLVFPNVVEAALTSHPSVVECAVVGRPDEQLGEAVVAFVVTSVATSTDELKDHVAGELGKHAAPRTIHFLAALPQLVSGKVDRRALRERRTD